MQKLEDDDGVVHKIKIKEKLYVPKLDHYLLSLHHVVQELEKEPGTTCATQHGSNCALIIPGLKKTIHNDGSFNVSIAHSAQDASTTKHHQKYLKLNGTMKTWRTFVAKT